MARELFRGNDRDECHRRHTELLKDHPKAVCTEDFGSMVFCVLDEEPMRPTPVQPAREARVQHETVLTDEEIDRIATRIIEKLTIAGVVEPS